MLSFVRSLFGRKSRQPLLSDDQREEFLSYLRLHLAGGRLMSDHDHPYYVIASYVAAFMKLGKVSEIRSLSDQQICQLWDIRSATLNSDQDFAALVKGLPKKQKTLLEAIRRKTAKGRAELQNQGSSGRSAEKAISFYGLRPVDPLRLRG